MNYCENFKGVLKAYDSDKNKRLLAIARCKMWSCAYCAVKNRQKWRALILDCINKAKRDWCWFTMTAKESTRKHRDIQRSSYVNLRGAFSKLMKRLRRKFGNDIIYVRVFEQHKNEALHIHCIASIHFDDIVIRNKGKKNQYSDSRWLRRNVVECGAGYMTHAENIDSKRSFMAVGYVTKYMTKTGETEQKFLRGIRRIQTSRHIKFSGNGDSELEFKLSTGYWLDEYETDMNNGTKVYSITEHRSLELLDFQYSRVYPK